MIDIFKKLNIYLELSNEKHHKFYEIILGKNYITVNYGRIGRKGKVKTLFFNEYSQGYLIFKKQVLSKVKKGYRKSIKGLSFPKIKGIHPGQLRLF